MPARGRDAERPLTAEGKDEVEKIARSLSELKFTPDYIISSPLKRTMETAQIVQRVLKKARSTNVEMWDELKPEGSRQELYKRLSALKPNSKVLVVGHDPYLTQLIDEVLVGNGTSAAARRPRISLKKAGLARVQVLSFTPAIGGELRWLLTPKLLKKIS